MSLGLTDVALPVLVFNGKKTSLAALEAGVSCVNNYASGTPNLVCTRKCTCKPVFPFKPLEIGPFSAETARFVRQNSARIRFSCTNEIRTRKGGSLSCTNEVWSGKERGNDQLSTRAREDNRFLTGRSVQLNPPEGCFLVRFSQKTFAGTSFRGGVCRKPHSEDRFVVRCPSVRFDSGRGRDPSSGEDYSVVHSVTVSPMASRSVPKSSGRSSGNEGPTRNDRHPGGSD